MLKNWVFTEFAENPVLGPLLRPNFEGMTPSGTIFGSPWAPQNSQKNGKKLHQETSETRPSRKNWDGDDLDATLRLQGLIWGSGRGPGLHFDLFFHENWMKIERFCDTLCSTFRLKNGITLRRKSMQSWLARLILGKGV